MQSHVHFFNHLDSVCKVTIDVLVFDTHFFQLVRSSCGEGHCCCAVEKYTERTPSRIFERVVFFKEPRSSTSSISINLIGDVAVYFNPYFRHLRPLGRRYPRAGCDSSVQTNPIPTLLTRNEVSPGRNTLGLFPVRWCNTPGISGRNQSGAGQSVAFDAETCQYTLDLIRKMSRDVLPSAQNSKRVPRTSIFAKLCATKFEKK